MKKRLLYYELEQYFDHKNVLIITGMRQVGKTTLMKQVFEQVSAPKLWFDFDNPLDTLFFEEIDYKAIYRKLCEKAGTDKARLFVFIDEIQNFPEITRIIKYHIDHFGVKYIVTGSSNFYLRGLFPESLSGRKFLFRLDPMGFREIRYFHNLITENEARLPFEPEKRVQYGLHDYHQLRPLFNAYLEFGGFPEVVVTENRDVKKMVLKNIFSSFFEKDLRLLSDFQDIRELRDLILLLVPRTGNMIDITRLAAELGTNRVKIYNYLEYLQGAFLIRLIPKYSASIDKSVAGGRKLFFTDTGLLNIIGQVNDGQLLETAVGNQLAAYGDLNFVNLRNTAEIDFVLNRETAFEVKLTATRQDLSRLHKTTDRIRLKKYYLISLNFTETDNTLYPLFI